MTQPQPQPLDLDAIEARANAATPGPWTTDGWEIYQGDGDSAPDLMKWVGETCRADDYDGSRDDAAFIAHARTDVPAMAAEIRRLRAELARLVQCNDCGAVGEIFTGTDGRAYLDPSGQIGHQSAARP